MPQTLDDAAFDRLIAHVRHLVQRAVDHERRLVSLVELAEGQLDRGAPTPSSTGGSAGSHDAGWRAIDLLPPIRQSCAAARDQRQFTESLLGSLNGGPISAAALDRLSDTVLIVDDAEDTREVLAAALGAAGLDTITAGNGLEGLLTAHTLRPAVILMDLRMPVLDGIEATRLLKAGGTTRHAHVIAHTATPAFIEGATSRLFADVVSKPASPADVVSVVRRLLGERPERAPGT
jgi:CheY-like chemotaxis protein